MGVVCDFRYSVRVCLPFVILTRGCGVNPHDSLWFYSKLVIKHVNCYQGKLHCFEPYIQPLGTNTRGHCTNVVFLNQETSTTSGLFDVELE